MDDNVEYIEKLSDYMKYVEDLGTEFTLSRGQAKDYPLLPGALRMDSKDNRKYSRTSATYFLNEFKVNAHNYIHFPWDIKDDYEWMIYAQHHGIPTRLLDFTYSHIVSLMFAVEKAFDDEGDNDAVVWFLNPIKLNHKFAKRLEILNIANGERFNLDDYDGPVAMKGRKLNNRINAQNGLFIYFQDTDKPLESFVTDKNILRKLVIKGEYKKDILASLYSMGIGFTSIYPELDSVAKDIIMKRSIVDYIREGA
jgi:hypothetical protein